MSEAEDWVILEKWRLWSYHEMLFAALEAPLWLIQLEIDEPRRPRSKCSFSGPRAEVLKSAAEWCQQEEQRRHAESLAQNLCLAEEYASTHPWKPEEGLTGGEAPEPPPPRTG